MKNLIPKFFVSRLKFVRQGSNLSGESGRWRFFFGKSVLKMRVLGWLDAFRTVKLALLHSCEKASYLNPLNAASVYIRSKITSAYRGERIYKLTIISAMGQTLPI